jgi:transmembrane sensor
MTLDRTYEEAAAWLARQHGQAMDWEAFTVWLEADPRNRAAFDSMALLDSELDENASRISKVIARDDLSSANGLPRVRWGTWVGFGGAAVAASLAGLLWVQPAAHETATHDFRSPAAKMVRIAFNDGASIALAPASELRVRGDHMDLQGSAFFDIPHLQGRTLNISVREFQVTDIGTRFSIDSEPEAVTIEVAQGSVEVSSSGLAKAISLTPGEGLVADPSGGTVRLTSVDAQEVGSWRAGKLQFNNAPLALVAQEISRYSGEKVAVDPTISGQPFSGVIAINHGEAPVETLAQILSLEIKTVDGARRLQPRRK